MKTYTFDVETSAYLLDLMGHSGRLQVLKLVSEKEWDVSSLATEVGLSQSALSQHLKKLRDGKLVTTRRDAQTVFYSCNSEAVRRVLTTLVKISSDPVQPNSDEAA